MNVKTICAALTAILMTFSALSVAVSAETTASDVAAAKVSFNAEKASKSKKSVSDTVEAEAGETYEGVVVAVDEESITVESDGNNVIIPISDDTEFVRGMNDKLPKDDMDSEEAPPEKPDGEMDSDGTPPGKPDGEMDSDEAPPEMPDGNMGRGSDRKPDGKMSGMGKDSDEAPPEKPDEDMEKPDDEDLSISNISVGDMIKVEVDDDGNAETVTLYIRPQGRMDFDNKRQMPEPEEEDEEED